ncbi:mitochondrial tRNA methylthiotransferase CDK5RAP1 [Rhipicephalus sanguineus]|uniref:mitochondrial tRNA methylthiotransferase CDK5RAP1 n=1 Tax=Rhipicephalus sanguineus TaxID=34632 RepID=UPI001894FB88|nr:mitochondrial tRNA methylthiotransferase CDK5RAP1 [Rhipicephalus sanguineus]
MLSEQLLFSRVLCQLRRNVPVCRRLCNSAPRELDPSVKERISRGPSLEHFIANTANSDAETERPRSAEQFQHPYVAADEVRAKGKKVHFETYGCQMNVNDTEVAWSLLKEAGFVRTDSASEADVVLIMTCAIREGAEGKIWSRINQLKHLRKLRHAERRGPLQIGILGCMAERLKEKLIEKEKAVDIVAGPDSYRDLPRLLTLAHSGQVGVNVQLSLDETYADVVPVRLNENSKSAFVSIMRGCNNMCSYCIVPFTRGRERSRPLASILDEVRALSDQGVKEVTLLGQNVNSYRDTSAESQALIERSKDGPEILSRGFRTVYKLPVGGLRFADLLDRVSQVDKEMRIRFTSPHPKDFPDEVLEVIRDRDNICKQIHLPAQSGNNAILERMRRGYTREAYLELVDRIRDVLPNVALSSDFICGFCGETEEAHEDTMSLVDQVKYSVAYVFPYSLREKTHAHRRLEDNVPLDVKKRRVGEVLSLFRHHAKELFEQQISTHQLVLVEGASRRSPEDMAGRNDNNVKVVFPKILVPEHPSSSVKKQIQPGDYVVVQIQDCSSQVLKGMPLYATSLQQYMAGEREQMRLRHV